MLCSTCKIRMGIVRQGGAENDVCPSCFGAPIGRCDLATILERTTPGGRPTRRRTDSTATSGDRQRDPDRIHFPEPTGLPRRGSGWLDRFGFG